MDAGYPTIIGAVAVDIVHHASAGTAWNLQAEAGFGDVCELNSVKAIPLLQGACRPHSEWTVVDREHLNHEIVCNRCCFSVFKVYSELDSGKALEKRHRHTGVNLVCDGVPEMESGVE